jgi:hypothetical protein
MRAGPREPLQLVVHAVELNELSVRLLRSQFIVDHNLILFETPCR